MSYKQRVTISIDPERLEKWDRAVEQSEEYQHRTGLIRRAVTNEIGDGKEQQRREVRQPEGSYTTDELLEETEHLLDRTLDAIQYRFDDVEEEITAIQNTVGTGGEFPLDLDAVLMELITDPDVEGPIRGLTASQVAERYGGDAKEIRQRLQKLAQDNPLVKEQREEVQYKDGVREIEVYWCEQPDAGTGAER